MGCSNSADAENKQSNQAKPVASGNQPNQPGGQYGGWGQPGNQVMVAAPVASDPYFLQTMAPSGTTWRQYVNTGASFVDPATGFLAGPWAECLSWAVVFEHTNPNFNSMPEYQDNGPAGGVIDAMMAQLGNNPNAGNIQAAMDKLEAASHALAESGQPLPAIKQVVTLPQNAVPGQQCRVANPQTPGTYMNVQVPQNAQPGQPIMTQAPVQPNQQGNGKKGMSTGAKVGFALGGAALVGGCAYAGAMAGEAGAFDGAIDAAPDVMEGAGDAAMDVGDFAGDAFGDAGDFLTDMF